MSRHFVSALLSSALMSAAVFCSAAAPPPETPAARLAAAEAQYPPWQNGENDDAINRGLVFTVPPVDDMADFHGSLDDPALVLYASGNYFFERSARRTRPIAAGFSTRRCPPVCC